MKRFKIWNKCLQSCNLQVLNLRLLNAFCLGKKFFFVSGDGVKTDLEKVAVVEKWTVPIDASEVRSFVQLPKVYCWVFQHGETFI